jgi:hypothetical protein
MISLGSYPANPVKTRFPDLFEGGWTVQEKPSFWNALRMLKFRDGPRIHAYSPIPPK